MISTFANLADSAFDAALSVVYPQPCAVCGASVESRHDGVACARCWETAPLFCGDETICWRCGALSDAQAIDDRRELVRCSRCETDWFDAARACGLYEGALRATVLELKRNPHISRRAVQQLYETQQRAPLTESDLIVPVPLHHARERERGFNQALVIASALIRLCRLPLEEHALTRSSETNMHRAGMDAKARRRSVADAFSVRHADLIAGKRLLLIDDVFTTGATASACSKILKEAGAAQVFVLTIARAAVTQ